MLFTFPQINIWTRFSIFGLAKYCNSMLEERYILLLLLCLSLLGTTTEGKCTMKIQIIQASNSATNN